MNISYGCYNDAIIRHHAMFPECKRYVKYNGCTQEVYNTLKNLKTLVFFLFFPFFFSFFLFLLLFVFLHIPPNRSLLVEVLKFCTDNLCLLLGFQFWQELKCYFIITLSVLLLNSNAPAQSLYHKNNLD